MHFVVCADTVIIDSTLMNPGKNISVFARRIICKPGARLITTAFAPAPDWKGGDYPQQTDRSAGAAGANGANGGKGDEAGGIAIRAESIVTDTAGTLTGVKMQALELRDVLKDKNSP